MEPLKAQYKTDHVSLLIVKDSHNQTKKSRKMNTSFIFVKTRKFSNLFYICYIDSIQVKLAGTTRRLGNNCTENGRESQ